MQFSLGRPEAAAHVRGVNGLYGSVHFYQMSEGALVVARIFKLPVSETGVYGFHIHEGNSCTGVDFADTGSHYNPQKTSHPNHVGDLPPLFFSKGRAFMAVLTDRFTIEEIIGKTVVIHSQPDDFKTQPAGAAGEKIACGVITAM